MAELKQITKCRCLRSKSSYSAFGEYHEDREVLMGSTSTFLVSGRRWVRLARTNIMCMLQSATKAGTAFEAAERVRPSFA